MKILTWNINGIRAASRGKTLKQLLDSLEADIICLQETKVTRDMLNEATAIVDGYTSYFSFSKVRSGYSGVATFCRETVTPVAAEEGLSAALRKDPGIGFHGNLSDFTFEELDALDAEGRTVITQYSTTSGRNLVVINVYCPRADKDNEERVAFKLKFYKLLQRRAESLVRSGRDVIVLGDINTSHKMIDHCDPCSEEEFSANPGRKWMNNFVKDLNPLSENISTKSDENTAENNSLCEQIGLFIDSFRYFHPNQREAFTNWSTVTSARQTNYGTRIDYIFANEGLVLNGFTNCVIRPDIEGSDHCPVVATLNITLKSAERPPAFCTKYMPEFSGIQSKLNAYFQPRGNQGMISTESLKHGGKKVKNDSCEKNTKDDAVTVAKRPGSISSFPVAKRAKISSGKSKTKQQSMFSFFSDLSENTKVKTRDVTKNGKLFANKNDTQENFEHSNDDSESLASSQSSTSSGQVLSSYEEIIDKTNVSSCESSSEELVSSIEKTVNVTEMCSLKKETEDNRKEEVAFWKNILKGPRPPPRCPGHNEPSVLRTVKIKGPNQGRKFYCCARPEGHSDNPEARCKFFKWVK